MKKISNSFFKKIILFLLVFNFVLCGVSCSNDDEIKRDFSETRVVNYTTGVDLSSTPNYMVKNGVALYSILLPEDVDGTTFAAAYELVDYVKQTTGATMHIVWDSSVIEGNYISIGNTKQFANLNIDVSNIKHDGYMIKTVDNNVYIAANLTRGVQYGVYNFMERFMGIRWFDDSYTYVPKAEDIVVYSCDILDEPVFQMREWYNGERLFSDQSYLDHMKVYTGTDLWVPEFGTIGHNVTDSFGSKGVVNKKDVDPEDSQGRTYAQTHPEFFTDYTNNSTLYYDLCYSNGIEADGKLTPNAQTVASIMIEKVKIALQKEENASRKFVMLGKMDDRNAICHCDKCLEKREVIGEGGIHVMFFNCIAREVNEWLKQEQNGREIYIVPFAYQFAFFPPTIEDGKGGYKAINDLCMVDEHVVFKIASIDVNYTYSLNDPRQDPGQVAALKGWQAISNKFMFWDYNTSYTEYYWYWPSIHYMKENFKYYKDMGVMYMFNQASYTQKNVWQDEIKAYIASKLYWDTDWDVGLLFNEYIEHCYGIASDNIKTVINSFEQYFAELRQNDSFKMTILGEDVPGIVGSSFDINWLNSQIALLKQTLVEVQADTTIDNFEKYRVYEKVQNVLVTPMRMVMRNYNYYYDESTKMTFGLEFYGLCEELGIVNLGESGATRSVAARKKADLGI